jgi:peptidoglycan/xylan/chitin deacetylase (PgdA/CDA1 family)
MKVLMLHDIREFDQSFFPERYKLPYFLVPEQFDNIVNNLLAQKSKLLSLSNNLIISAENISNDITLLTFDDGLKDHLSIARNLASKNIKACFFIPSGPLFEHSIIDSHKIQFILASVSSQEIINFINDSFEYSFNTTHESLNEYYISRWRNNIWSKEMIFVTRVLREYPNKIWKRQLINDLFYKYVSIDSKAFSSEFYLSQDDVLEIKSLGHIIGGHGHYSYDLSFEDFDTIESELFKMNDFLMNLNQEVKYYAYANGGYNLYVINKLMEFNFDLAFTTGHRSVQKSDSSLEIPRIDATKTDLIF